MERKVRDSCGKSASKGDPAGACAEEAPGPPAESECLKWKSTSKNCNHTRGVEVLFCGYKLGMSSCNSRYLSDFFSGALRFSMDINERIQQVDGGNFTELDGPKIGCSFIIEGKGFTNIFTQKTQRAIYL